MLQFFTPRKGLIGTAAFVGSVYLVLVVASLFCATAHAGHHGHDSSHTPLCAWACQANSSVGLVSLETPALPILLAIYLLAALPTLPLSAPRIRLSSRGPPVR